jgi:transcriptional regulator with XRE-family HTH domain
MRLLPRSCDGGCPPCSPANAAWWSGAAAARITKFQVQSEQSGGKAPPTRLRHMDDATVGRAIRALRFRRRWRQIDLGDACGLSQTLVSRAERGHLDTLSIRSVRAMFAALDAGCTLAPWWRSGQLDRLLDEDHAALSGRAAALLQATGWDVHPEATFAIYGERGSIDLLGTKPEGRRALMTEIKPTITSTEELTRTADRKTRLLPQIVEQRLGWRPASVGRLLIVADTSTNRRRIARADILATSFPIRGGDAIDWLRSPSGAGSALIFQSVGNGRAGRRRVITPGGNGARIRRTSGPRGDPPD